MVKNNETKRDRFKRVAEKRTNKVLKMLKLLGNCSNKNNYDYTKGDVNKIINAIEEEVKALKYKFNDSSSGKDEFSL